MSNNEVEDNIKIVKSLEDSGLLLNGVTETFQNEVKERKGEQRTKSVSKETKSKRKKSRNKWSRKTSWHK